MFGTMRDRWRQFWRVWGLVMALAAAFAIPDLPTPGTGAVAAAKTKGKKKSQKKSRWQKTSAAKRGKKKAGKKSAGKSARKSAKKSRTPAGKKSKAGTAASAAGKLRQDNTKVSQSHPAQAAMPSGETGGPETVALAAKTPPARTPTPAATKTPGGGGAYDPSMLTSPDGSKDLKDAAKGGRRQGRDRIAPSTGLRLSSRHWVALILGAAAMVGGWFWFRRLRLAEEQRRRTYHFNSMPPENAFASGLSSFERDSLPAVQGPPGTTPRQKATDRSGRASRGSGGGAGSAARSGKERAATAAGQPPARSQGASGGQRSQSPGSGLLNSFKTKLQTLGAAGRGTRPRGAAAAPAPAPEPAPTAQLTPPPEPPPGVDVGSFERYIEVQVAIMAWQQQGLDAPAQVQKVFSLSSDTWMRISGYWGGRLAKESGLRKQFDQCEPIYRRKYSDAA